MANWETACINAKTGQRRKRGGFNPSIMTTITLVDIKRFFMAKFLVDAIKKLVRDKRRGQSNYQSCSNIICLFCIFR